MGINLRSPIIVGSSRITAQMDTIRQCADHGAGAIVLKSLFEEQLLADKDLLHDQDQKYFWYPEAVDYINEHAKASGVKEYLKLLESAKTETGIPIISSIHCTTPREWPAFAKNIENAGADAIELNIYIFPMNEDMESCEIEETYVRIVEEVKKNVNIPISVKLSPMLTNPIRLIKRLCISGIKASVVFNRYFRPDINIEDETIVKDNIFSGPEEMSFPLRWVSLLSDRVRCDIAGSTGVHDASGVIKHLLAGAAAVQVCSTLYINGIEYLEKMNLDLEDWMKRRNYDSIDDFRGKISRNKENIAAFERVQFMKKNFGEDF